MKKFIAEFKEFALKGNVMDMAIGVIIGGAFASIISALTDNIINPIIGCFTTGGLEGWTVTIWKAELGIGAFIMAIINFIILAFVLFLISSITSISSTKEKCRLWKFTPVGEGLALLTGLGIVYLLGKRKKDE